MKSPHYLLIVTVFTLAAQGEIRRNPSVINVNAQGPTTAFISYGNLQGKVAAEALWCADVVPASPDIGQKCNPATTWGRLPLRYDQTRPSGNDGLTDIMTIPQNVARRSYERATKGGASEFFYVRRFVDPSGGPDEYVAIAMRLTGGGAGTPMSLTDVRLRFTSDKTVLSVPSGAAPPAFGADVSYTGTGRLVGRWEVVLPGEELPTAEDLLTEASLPVERRAMQRRYTQVERFNVHLPPGGKYRLNGPDPARLPTGVEGLYLILLRVEASYDTGGNSSLSAVGAGNGMVWTGGVAGFSLPVLRYYVGSVDESLEKGRHSITLLLPQADVIVDRAKPVELTWTGGSALTGLYRVEIADTAGQTLLTAMVEKSVATYRLPAWVFERAAGGRLVWRVAGVDAEGRVVDSSSTRALEAMQATTDPPQP